MALLNDIFRSQTTTTESVFTSALGSAFCIYFPSRRDENFILGVDVYRRVLELKSKAPDRLTEVAC